MRKNLKKQDKKDIDLIFKPLMLKFIFIFIACILIATTADAQNKAVPVTLYQGQDGAWQLLRDGQPFFIKGVGGHTALQKAKEIGANSLRTWSTDNAQEILDNAQKLGLTVMLGLWVQHERHGFNYDDTAAVRAQLMQFTEVVHKFKNHPALLLWGIGNEVDLAYTNTNVWYAINDIASMIHRVDPNHPTITVTAGLDQEEVNLIKTRAPEIDIYGVNTYGDINKVKGNIKKYGWEGPYIITEWGPDGHWEVNKTKWGAPIEQSSSEKADAYQDRYTSAIIADKNQCIGSYVFLWGFKQETTSTWYGLFDKNGASSEVVDVLAKFWNPGATINTAPRLDSAFLAGLPKGSDIIADPRSRITSVVYVHDADNDKLNFVYEIVQESRDIKSGGDAETPPPAVRWTHGRKKGNSLSFRTPADEGAYRLFIYIYDSAGHYAYCNIPFYVFDSSKIRVKPTQQQ